MASAEPKTKETPPDVAAHGGTTLTAVTVDSFNAQLRDENGFIGDSVRRAAFFEIFDRWRALGDRKLSVLGDTPTAELSKSQIDEALADGRPHEQALIHSAIEEYACKLLAVIRHLMRTKDWRETQRIVVGGGLRGGRFAEIAVARTELLARAHDMDVELRPIRHDPDEAGLIGAAHLAPSWMFASFEDILAVDIGGTNMRCGIVRLNLDKAEDLSKARVRSTELWRHGDEEVSREQVVERLIDMLQKLIHEADKDDVRLAPFIGVGCPGSIADDGTIENGAQNLPGNWESSRFNLPAALWQAIPSIGGHETAVVMHNDAVVQGLSEVPFMQDVERWGVLTIGTGLGNARFTNRARGKAGEGKGGKRDERKADKKKD
ncbi:ROK family protein [Ancylobacter sp. MQZ15Z-1]|uniref:ROK family protein n=1 Tax=Ancylobacter mangrovi TaxID=2972472 RepID=A0A9X2PDK1_9HYPH|nr:ROK family protein [Ancylobacter mangrovi]MCS0494010.1 ROK family protein [Ancylobacter mangrovi]